MNTRPGDKVYSVTEITTRIRDVLEGHFEGPITVLGEVSNYKRHSSGHIYFSLKDENAVLRCVCFRGDADGLSFEPADGLSVIAEGEITVYPRGGQYQLVVTMLGLAGPGDLYRALEELKAKLAAEGLFEAARKKTLPKYPRRIGVVTSESGAAFRDIKNVLSRRWPGITVVVRDTRVQGVGSAEDIAAAIEEFNLRADVDVLIVGRGGGSLEDLWAFNEEAVVRAVAASAIPTVSAVGHEVDWTLTDSAADLRAPTPSAAAELVVPEKDAVIKEIRDMRRICGNLALQEIYDSRNRFLAEARAYGMRAVPRRIKALAQEADGLYNKLVARALGVLKGLGSSVSKEFARLAALSPAGTLARGYTLTVESDSETLAGKVLGREPGERLGIIFYDGRAGVTVEEITKGGPFG